MPQFDKITFFNQIFWLFFFFSGFYLILLNFFLPNLGSVLKARSKKLQRGTEGVFIFSKEQDSVTSLSNVSFEGISTVVKTSITKTTDKIDSYVSNQFTSLNDYSFFKKTLGLAPISTSGRIASCNTVLEKVAHNQIVTSFLFSRQQIVKKNLRLIFNFE